ncbi:MAG: acetyl-CoA C-acetyltransferase [Deltaproteobacteria bacterium]|nr:MAG: acetyl-CoA C-acetyltransferase [Deltaproteobacteria bacterium]
MPEAFIYDAVRTPRGKGKSSGSLYVQRPIDLAATALASLRDRTGLDTSLVDDVVLGCVTQAKEQGACIARFAALQAGYDLDAPGSTVNRFCGSGLEAVNSAASMVGSGFFDCAIGGGVESMSRVPMGSDGGAIFDVSQQWSFGSVPQGISADLIATMRGYSRADVDAFALESQRRAGRAIEAGVHQGSLVPVLDESGLPILAVDELPRPDSTLEGLGKLQPAFEMMGRQFKLDTLVRKQYPHVHRVEHVHTAGNSSGIVDGAAAVLLGNAELGQRLGITPRARVRSMAVVGEEPLIMLTGPMPATRKALQRAGMSVGDIDLFEVNEAFASVVLAFMEELDVPHDKVNLWGGAIAYGHPLGATGAMLLNTALDALEQKGLGTACITLCIGGGMGIATIIERV